MQARYKWLLLPPAIALLLFLGPLREPTAPAVAGAASGTPGAAAPASPNLTQVASATIGVILLGIVAVLAFGRISQRRRPTPGEPLALRQSLRLSGRHTLHLVQVDERVLLLGECDGNVAVLDRIEGFGGEDDERRVALDDEEDGAVPRDLIIPRPPRQKTPAAKPRKTPARPAELAQFQTLLQLARKASKSR